MYIYGIVFITKRFDSFYILIALIYKNKNRLFKIRRKNIKWLTNEKTLFANEVLTISKYIWQNVFKDKKMKTNFIGQIHVLQNDAVSITHWRTDLNSFFANKFLDFYIQYCASILNNRYNKNIKDEYNFNLIVLSSPQTQLFFTMLKRKVFLIFTCGIIRLVMQLIDKCSKKKKIVILNGIKFMWLNALKSYNSTTKIKFKGNYNYIRSVFNKNSKESQIIDYIFYEPKLNFGFNDLPKRASVKKKLRKKKKYKSE